MAKAKVKVKIKPKQGEQKRKPVKADSSAGSFPVRVIIESKKKKQHG